MKKPEALPRPAFEPKDADVRVVAATAAALVALVGVSFVLAIGLRLWAGRGRASETHPRPAELFQNGPNARTSIETSWPEIEASVHKNLSEYSWVDRKTGLARIPIDRAMDLVVREHEASSTSSPEARP
jgi:hypothetical protein